MTKPVSNTQAFHWSQPVATTFTVLSLAGIVSSCLEKTPILSTGNVVMSLLSVATCSYAYSQKISKIFAKTVKNSDVPILNKDEFDAAIKLQQEWDKGQISNHTPFQERISN